MISTSTEFNTVVSSTSRTFRARFQLNGELLSCDVKSIKVYKGACGDQLSPGSIFVPYIESEIAGCTVNLENEELTLQIGLLLGYDDSGNERIEYIDIGKFTVTDPNKTTGGIQFTAVGRLSAKCSGLYTSALTYPATIQAVLDEIVTQTGVPIVLKGMTVSGSITTKPTGLTYRDAIGYIAGLLEGFATEDNSGNVVIARYGSGDTLSVDGDRSSTAPSFNDYDYSVTGIKVVVTDDGEDEDGNTVSGISYSSGTPNITVSNPYMTEEIFNATASNIVGYKFRPGTVELALGDPRLEAWDSLSVTDTEAVTHIVPCLEVTHTFDGGISSEVLANANSTSAEDSETVGAVSKLVEQLSADLFTANTAILKRLKVADAELNYAKIDLANITNGTIKTAMIGDAQITGAKIANATITDAQIGALNADKIKSGTLTTDRLIIRDPDTNTGILWAINNGAVKQDDLTEEELKRLTLDGQVIKAKTIFAEQINVDDLFSKNITATGSITGANIISGSFSCEDTSGSSEYYTDISKGVAHFYSPNPVPGVSEVGMRFYANQIVANAIHITTDPAYGMYLHQSHLEIETPTQNQVTLGLSINNGILGVTNFGNTLYIGSQNGSYVHYMASGSMEHYFSNNVICGGSQFRMYNDHGGLYGQDGMPIAEISGGHNTVIGPASPTSLRTGGASCTNIYGPHGIWLNDTAYTKSGSVITSDENAKKDILDINQKYIDMFDLLPPKTFRYKNGDSGRIHVGYKAQDVKAAMDKVGLTDMDFAGWCKYKNDAEEVFERVVADDGTTPEYTYALRYIEFIPIMAAKMKQLETRIAKLEGN